MEHRNFPGTDVNASLLGIGCMRLPTNEDGSINEPEAIALIRYAIDHGVTYVDTAYGYHGGMSEVLVGKALRDGYREKVTLTSKLPVWLVKTYDDMERLLDGSWAACRPIIWISICCTRSIKRVSMTYRRSTIRSS